MSRSKFSFAHLLGGLALSIIGVIILLVTPVLVAWVPAVGLSSFAELALNVLPTIFSLCIFVTGLAMIASNGVKGGLIRHIGKRLVALSGITLMISYANLLLVIIMLLAPINQGALLLGFGLALLIGIPSIKPVTRVYLSIYRSF